MAKINQNYLSSSSITPTSKASGTAIRAPRVSTGPLIGNTLSGTRIAAPQMRTTPRAIAQPVQGPLITAKDVTDFATVIQQKTLRIQDETNTMLAREKLLQAKEQIRELGYGEESGFFLTEGRASVLGRKAVERRSDEIINSTLDGLDPAVQEKLVAPLLAEREAFNNQVARYSISQKKVWEKQVMQANLVQFDRQLSAQVGDKELSHKATLHKAFELFPDFQDGSPNVVNQSKRESFVENSAVRQMEMLKDTPGGVAAMSDRFEFYKERVSFPAQQKLLKVLETSIDDSNKNYKQLEKQYKTRAREAQDRVEDKLTAGLIDGSIKLSDGELAKGLREGKISGSFALKYKRESLSKTDNQAHKETVLAYEDLLLEYPDGVPGGTGSKIDVIELATKDESIPLHEVRRLRAMKKTLTDSNFKEAIKKGKEEIDIITAPSSWNKTWLSKMTESNRFLANRELQAGLNRGLEYDQIMAGIRERYTGTTLPKMMNNVVPTTVEQVQALANQIEQLQISGELDAEQSRLQFQILEKYYEKLSNGQSE